MVNIVNGVIDINSLEMKDIIDIGALQKFLDNFALGMNCAAVSVDRNGNEITKPSYYRPFCQDYIHKSTIGDSRCAKCHNQFGEEAARTGKPYIAACHAGMIDFAAPVIVKGIHLGTILGGQILDEAPDDDKIRNVAREIHVDSDELVTAAHKADIVGRRNIEAAAEVLNTVVNQLAQSGYNKLEIEVLVNSLSESFSQISTTIDNLAESAQTITESQDALSQEISEIKTTANNIQDIVVAISKTADRTNLIGLNASIEAARLGNAGLSFTIVAKEIRNLAANTKKTSEQITTLNESIAQKVNSTVSRSKDSLSATQDQSAAMEELSATVSSMLEMTANLKNLFTE